MYDTKYRLPKEPLRKNTFKSSANAPQPEKNEEVIAKDVTRQVLHPKDKLLVVVIKLIFRWKTVIILGKKCLKKLGVYKYLQHFEQASYHKMDSFFSS